MVTYVDDMYKAKIGRYGRMKMSHMIADTHEELLAMADTIGLDRKHLQAKPSSPYCHFDVSMSLRVKAVEAGAVEVTMRELVRKCREKAKK